LASVTSTSDFVALAHPQFPAHQVRVKKSDFCDSTVNVYTGYLDVDYGAKHMFFYFFESRRDPDNDDVMMWINGGPGCSSSLGCSWSSYRHEKRVEQWTTWNPYSWNSETNIFFLTSREVNVGFSYAEFGETIETTEDAAKNVHAFLTIFFETFSQFKGRPLHLAGESYGGRYLPSFGSYVYDQNQIAIQAGRDTLNLTSILIGNGVVDYTKIYRGRHEMECATAALPVPFQSISVCVQQKTALTRCEKAMQASCVEVHDEINCRAALSFCQEVVSGTYAHSGRNVYDISKDCIGDLCYAESGAITDYLNQPSVRSLLGVESPGNFTSCNGELGSAFSGRLDRTTMSQNYIAALLDRGVRVLIYSGTYDWQCNWVASRLWLEEMEWGGAERYRANAFRDWAVDGRTVGEVKTSGLLTFATIYGAGHMMSASF
ncbi:peptidase S10 serine carboxypeptidase, partial [Epithele typhae]|uniref:peptidase S10 serine carboxypeptidase n=1 Tax=Epithele typhae TaxID=378194 RepID=UPI0020076A40